MKTFRRITKAKCLCGTEIEVGITGHIDARGKLVKMMRDEWFCWTCGNREAPTKIDLSTEREKLGML